MSRKVLVVDDNEINRRLLCRLLQDDYEVLEIGCDKEALVNAAIRDRLTGLYNREAFFAKAEELIALHQPGYYVMTCFDINKFKVINDQYGIERGDMVLRQIAGIFSQSFEPEGGICCRVMADKFAVLYPYSFMESQKTADIRRAAAVLDGCFQPITFNIGRYIVNDLTLSASAMYDRATMALTSVKGRYDISIAVYDESMRQNMLREQKIVNEMNTALESGQFEVWLQPQYNHASGALIGAEALVRWRHPQSGLIAPNEFIPVFERNGFIYEMDKYVWQKTCLIIRQWLDAGQMPVPVSVNISRYDMFREDFYQVLTGYMEQYNIPVNLLRLEITESAFSESTAQIIAVTQRLIDYGFAVEIDDFGSGYSSLNTLKDVPASILKLDMRFVDDNENSTRGGNILESVVRMAKWLDMSVIAEGVETRQQAEYLKSIGCYYVQGYLYARPMPQSDYENLVAQSDLERKMKTLETVESLDNNAFWNPKSMETLIFNSYVGGACIFEYHNGRTELLRANQKYARELGGDATDTLSLLSLSLEQYLDESNKRLLYNCIVQAIATDLEACCELCLSSVGGRDECMYMRIAVRVIAKAGDRRLFYCSVINMTEEKRAERQIIEASEQLRVLNEISSELLASENSDEAIKGVLDKVRDYFGAVRSFVFELDRDKLEFNNTYEVYQTEMNSQLKDLQHISTEVLPFWLQSFEKYEQVYIADVNILPDSRREERELLLAHNVSSLIAVPLRSKRAVIGFIGVDNPVQNVDNVGRLAALGDYIAVMLTRRDLMAKIENDNEMLHNLMNDTPGGFTRMRIMNNAEIVLLYANDGFCQMVGMPFAEIMKLYSGTEMSAVHPEDREKVTAGLKDILARGGRFRIYFRLRHGQGGYVELMVFGRLVQNEAGEHFINAYYTNMSEQNKQEEQRRELLDNMPCGAGIYEISAESFAAVYLNKRYLEMVGRKVDNLETVSVLEFVHPEDRQRLLQELRLAMEHDSEGTCNIRILHGSGEYRSFKVTGKIMERGSGKSVVYVTYIPVSRE